MCSTRKRKDILTSGTTATKPRARKRASRRVTASTGWEIGSNGSSERVRHLMDVGESDLTEPLQTESNMGMNPDYDFDPNFYPELPDDFPGDHGDMALDGDSDFHSEEEDPFQTTGLTAINEMQKEMQQERRRHVQGLLCSNIRD